MKNENGKAKAILIAIIAILLIALFAVLIVFKFIGNGNKKNEDSAKAAQTDTMTYVATTDKDYVFIDTNANVRKIKKDSLGKNAISMNEGTTIYNNSLLVKNDDGYAIIDFNGNKIYEAESIKIVESTKEATLYEVRKDGKSSIVNAKGEEIIKPEHSELFSSFGVADLDGYIYVTEYASEFSGDALNVYDKDGKRVYRGPVDSSFSGYTANGGITRSGVPLLVARKNATSIGVINLKTGEEFNTITDNNDHAIDIDIKGNYAVIKSYARGTYGADQGDNIVTYYWFGEDGKVSKKLNLTDKEYISYWNGSLTEDYTIYKNYTTNEETAIDKYGKDVYKTTGSLSQKQYTNSITGKTTSYVIEEVKRKYKTIKSDGSVLFEDKAVSAVGNKYVASGTTLYKQDGTQYMENIKGYISVYNLDIIKTADKIIIENQEGKSIEKPADFDLGKEAKLLNDNTVVLTNDKKFIVINMNDLSMKELDFSTARSAYVEEGYIMTYGTGSTREYYNANGDKIYTYKE
ncbi:MAG: hypothetical protein IKE91_07345 [Clostridia bacterium]|nr:hypothetical protein [Clostridia bacterium]